jgi:kumamolisin
LELCNDPRVRFWAASGIVVAVLAVLSPSALAAGPPAQAARIGAAPASQRLALVFPLKADLAGLHRFAQAVTTPGSPQYGQYQSIAALARRFGANVTTRARVTRYLQSVGASDVKLDATGLVADATVTARLATRLFNTRLGTFRSARQGRFVAPTAATHVPAGLRGLVTGVVGLDTRSLGASSAPTRAAGTTSPLAHTAAQPTSALPLTGQPAGCTAGVAAGGFTPNQYETAYGLLPLFSAGLRGQGERVALIEIDGFRDSDITSFAKCFGLDVPGLNAFGVGIKHPLAPGGEATLDLEVLDSAAPDLKAIDVYETKPSASDTLRALTAPLQHKGFHPQVISASLGLCEPDVDLAVGVKGIESVEGSLQMAAASGISFLASSGDQGSADCVGLDGQPIDRLAVNYPSSSPWVTGVGGTNLELNSTNGIISQIVWNDASLQPGAAGGGGVSRLFKRPSFQKGTVSRNARLVPDVAMLADIVPGYAVFCSASGECVDSANPNPWQTVGGTSAATPLLAGGLAVVDQDLRLNGRRDLGTINPLLYQVGRSATLRPQVFSDVVAFGNDVGPFIPGNRRALGCCSASAGFDRASGWGSVNLSGLAGVSVLLIPPHVSLSLPRPQHPIKRGAILARVSCSAACRIGAFAEVSIAGAKPVRVSSHVVARLAKGTSTIPIPLGAKLLGRVRAAAKHHQRVTATVVGRLYGSGAHVARTTGAKQLTI